MPNKAKFGDDWLKEIKDIDEAMGSRKLCDTHSCYYNSQQCPLCLYELLPKPKEQNEVQ